MAGRLSSSIFALSRVLVIATASTIVVAESTKSTTYTSDGTETTRSVGWYSTPNKRGTIDIIWSCLSTLFICLWASLHLNVPEKGTTWHGRLRTKITWLGISAIAPEVVFNRALSQFLEALGLFVRMRRRLHHSWTMTHSFAVVMGSIQLTSDQCQYGSTCIDAARFLKFVEEDMTKPSEQTMESKIAQIKLEHIQGKSDSFLNFVACTQMCWLILQCIGRSIQGLAITTLELATIAYSVCGLCIYLAWWSKPLDSEVIVEVCVTGDIPEIPYVPDISGLDTISMPPINGNFSRGIWGVVESVVQSNGKACFLSISLIVTAVFGGIHVFAWNYFFPSEVEKYMWRVCCVLSALMPFIYDSLWMIADYSQSWSGRWSKLATEVAIVCCLLVYVCARLYMIFEPFVLLRSAPASAYDTVNWSSFIPHI
jgi:hypothetical protein